MREPQQRNGKGVTTMAKKPKANWKKKTGC